MFPGLSWTRGEDLRALTVCLPAAAFLWAMAVIVWLTPAAQAMAALYVFLTVGEALGRNPLTTLLGVLMWAASIGYLLAYRHGWAARLTLFAVGVLACVGVFVAVGRFASPGLAAASVFALAGAGGLIRRRLAERFQTRPLLLAVQTATGLFLLTLAMRWAGLV